AARGRGADGFSTKQRVEQDARQRIFLGTERDDVRGGEQRIRIRAVTCDAQVFAEAPVGDRALYARSEWTIANENRPERRHVRTRRIDRGHKGERVFMLNEL